MLPPLRERRWSIAAVVASPAFSAKQAGLQHQPAGQQPVVEIQQQVQIAPAVFSQQPGGTGVFPEQSLEQCLFLQMLFVGFHVADGLAQSSGG